MGRQRTKSKIWYDDEILGIESDGTIHLKPGVIRIPKYRFSTENTESYYNNYAYYRDRVDKIKRQIEEDNEWD